MPCYKLHVIRMSGSMLAAFRRKKKWVVNPRAHTKSLEETYDFGFKILNKMGWQKGKGLGKDLQGIIVPIKLKTYFKQGPSWMPDHQSDFNELLANLNSVSKSPAMDVDNSSGLPSLEERSKEAKRYKKFLRGKDLSRCTLKDFVGILGKEAARNSLETIGLVPSLQKCEQNESSVDYCDTSNKFTELKEGTDLHNEEETCVLKEQKKKKKHKKKERDSHVGVHEENLNNKNRHLESNLSQDTCFEFIKKTKKSSRENGFIENRELKLEVNSCSPPHYSDLQVPIPEIELINEKHESGERQLGSKMEVTHKKPKKKVIKENCLIDEVDGDAVSTFCNSEIQILYERNKGNKSPEIEFSKKSKKKKSKNVVCIELDNEGCKVESNTVSGNFKLNTARTNECCSDENEKINLLAKKRRRKKMSCTSSVSVLTDQITSGMLREHQMARKVSNHIILIESEDSDIEEIVVKKKKKHKRSEKTLHNENGIANLEEDKIIPAHDEVMNGNAENEAEKLHRTASKKIKELKIYDCEFIKNKQSKTEVPREADHNLFAQSSKRENKTTQIGERGEPTPRRSLKSYRDDSDVLNNAIAGFVGANLKDILGYGNCK